ncbi:MAG: two-component regulator propeller domain-containing protein [Bacteroidia bacterium]|nr:two-component regulator propeller domain-containing protein [Bacteroidia bacterium]
MKRLLAVLTLFILWLNLPAAESLSYNVGDGLSSRRVYQIKSTSDGFLWIYSSGGLDRFDGSGFRHYQLDDRAVSRDAVQSATRLKLDGDGRLWVAFRNGKMYRYDALMDRFDRVAELAEVKLNDIFFSADGGLLLASGDGILRYRADSLQHLGLVGVEVNSISRGSGDRLWIASEKGLYRAAPDGSGAARLGEIPGWQILSVLEYRGKLYIGTFSDGAWSFDPESGALNRIKGIPALPVRVFCPGPDGKLLAGVDGAGIFLLNESGDAADRIWDDGELSDDTISDIDVDGAGRIWAATATDGINCILPERNPVLWTRHEDGRRQSLCQNHVNAIFTDRDGDFWYGTNRGVSLRGSGGWRHFLTEEGNVILALAQDRNGDVWAGGYGCGVYVIDKKSGVVRRVEDCPLKYVYYIYSDDETLWIGGLDGDLYSYSLEDGLWTGFESDCVGDIWPDGTDALWLAGCAGLGHLDKRTGDFVWRRDFGGVTLKYAVRALFVSSDSTLWLATDGDGLIHYDPSGDSTERFTTANGLLSDSVISVHEDRDGRIWLTTEEGLFWLDTVRKTIIAADDLLGISAGIFNPNSAWLSADGALSFGTSEGVLTFHPSELDYFSNRDRRLIFTDLSVNYDRIVPGDRLLPRSLDSIDGLVLPFRSNSFSLSFSSVKSGSDFRVRYEYKLEGYDLRWIPAKASGKADYVKVRPGRYSFILRAVDKYTGETLSERVLPLTVRRPVALRWWACLAYTLMLSLLLTMFLRYRRSRRYEERVREKMRTFVSVAHDLKTPVSLIKAPLSDLENMDDLPEAGRRAIGTASANADKLMSMISQLLDLRKAGDAGETLELTMTDIGAYVSSLLEDFRSAAVHKGLELTLDVSSDMPEVAVDCRKISLIVNNLLSNAVKYTEMGYISVEISPSSDCWTLKVSDSGRGIPADEISRVFSDSFRASNAVDVEGGGIGLMITRQVVRDHRADISLRSAEGKGSVFTVTFPYRYRGAEIIGDSVIEGVMPEAVRGGLSAERDTILVVDDERGMTDYLSSVLSAEYDVLTAADGGAALELARQRNPDIVVTDLVMPVLSGEDLCRMLKSSVETSHIPVILLTGVSDRQSIIFGLEAGADDYIVKPFDSSVMKARIRNLLSERQRLREAIMSASLPAEAPAPDYGNRLDKEFMDKVMAVMEREYSRQDFSINGLCMEVAMSRTSFYNKLKSLTGQAPNDFIRVYRLNRAKELLAEHCRSIAEVSDMVGFADAKYFSVCFKKQFGESPSKV